MTATHYVHRNSGQKVFVKEASFFVSQGGLREAWGRSWTPVVAISIEHARRVGEETLPKWSRRG